MREATRRESLRRPNGTAGQALFGWKRSHSQAISTIMARTRRLPALARCPGRVRIRRRCRACPPIRRGRRLRADCARLANRRTPSPGARRWSGRSRAAASDEPPCARPRSKGSVAVRAACRSSSATPKARSKGLPGRICPSHLIMSFSTAMTGDLFSGSIIALRAIRDAEFLGMVRPGDTIRTEVEIVEKRPASNPDRGVVVVSDHVYNQDDSEVFRNDKIALVRRRSRPNAARLCPGCPLRRGRRAARAGGRGWRRRRSPRSRATPARRAA